MVRELKTLGFWRAVLAELLGTTLVVFVGIMASIGNGNSSYPDQEVKVGLAFGLVFAVLSQSLIHISGAHLNPAVTLGMVVSCQVSVCRALWYILAQVAGAVLASGVVLGVRPAAVESLGMNKVSDFIELKCLLKPEFVSWNHFQPQFGYPGFKNLIQVKVLAVSISS